MPAAAWLRNGERIMLLIKYEGWTYPRTMDTIHENEAGWLLSEASEFHATSTIIDDIRRWFPYASDRAVLRELARRVISQNHLSKLYIPSTSDDPYDDTDSEPMHENW